MTTDRQHGDEVRARVVAATAGPWCVVNDDDWNEISVIRGIRNQSSMPNVCTPICTVAQDDDTADAELIAHAPGDLLRLLERAEKAETALERVKSVVSDLDRCEHGRHVADVCFGCTPAGLRAQSSRGNSVEVIGYDISGRPITVSKLLDAFDEPE